VSICKKDAVTTKSEIPRSSGDEAGLAKGIMSSTNMDKVTFKKGASKVKVEGSPLVLAMAMTAQNGSNANMPSGSQIAPSQTKVLVKP
jgi:hypothetical protein